MKTTLIASTLLFTSAVFASTCETNLLEKINKDPNIRVVKMVESYNCGEAACAVTFEHDSHPYPNLKVLAFLDLKNNLNVNWVPVNDEQIYGHETFQGKKISYVSTKGVGNDQITIDASIETARDAIFWPPHKVYFQETLNCSKL